MESRIAFLLDFEQAAYKIYLRPVFSSAILLKFADETLKVFFRPRFAFLYVCVMPSLVFGQIIPELDTCFLVVHYLLTDRLCLYPLRSLPAEVSGSSTSMILVIPVMVFANTNLDCGTSK